MKRVRLNNLFESSLPPEDINVLWADIDENTGGLKAIHKYNNSKGEWEPSMVSVDYMNPDDNLQEPNEIVYHSASTELKKYTLKDTTSNYKHHCFVIPEWENLPLPSGEGVIYSDLVKRGSIITGTYDRDWATSNNNNIHWTDGHPIINGVNYKLVSGIFGHFAGNDGFTHRFHAMSPALYESFKTGMTVSTNSDDKFDAVLIIKKI